MPGFLSLSIQPPSQSVHRSDGVVRVDLFAYLPSRFKTRAGPGSSKTSKTAVFGFAIGFDDEHTKRQLEFSFVAFDRGVGASQRPAHRTAAALRVLGRGARLRLHLVGGALVAGDARRACQTQSSARLPQQQQLGDAAAGRRLCGAAHRCLNG